MRHDFRGEDMHSEEAKVISRTKAGNDEFLLGYGGSGLLKNGRDFIKSLHSSHRGAADSSIKGEFAFVGRLDCRDGAVGLFRNCEELIKAGFFGEGQIEVVAHHQEEWVVSGEFLGAEDGVAISEGFALFDKRDLIEVVGDGRGEVSFRARSDDNSGGIDPAGEDFIEKEGRYCLCPAGSANQSLKGEMLLMETGCSDDCFFNLHGMFGKGKKKPPD